MMIINIRTFLTLTIYLLVAFAMIVAEKVIYSLDKKKCSLNKMLKILNLLVYTGFTGYLYINEYKVSMIIIHSITYLIMYYINRIDKDYLIIPDKYIIAIFILGVINIALGNVTLINGLLGFSIMCLVFILIVIIEFILKDVVLGGGDLKLFLALGLLFGFFEITLYFIITYIVSIIRSKNSIKNLVKYFKGNKDILNYESFAPNMYIAYTLIFAISESIYKNLLLTLK